MYYRTFSCQALKLAMLDDSSSRQRGGFLNKISINIMLQEDTGLCEFRPGYLGVDETLAEEDWTASQCIPVRTSIGGGHVAGHVHDCRAHAGGDELQPKSTALVTLVQLISLNLSNQIVIGPAMTCQGIAGYSTSKCAEWKPGKCMGKAQDLSTASKGLPIWDLAFEEGPETDALKTHAGG